MKDPRFVTPEGQLIVLSQKTGLLMGNRGQLRRSHYGKEFPCAPGLPWITCLIKENGAALPKADVKYTKLFFLDEVTALAAGHRPCYSCQRRRYHEFETYWGKAHKTGSQDFDGILAEDREQKFLTGRIFAADVNTLPGGTFVIPPGSQQPHLLLWRKLFPWTMKGYEKPLHKMTVNQVSVITSEPIVEMLMKGFPLRIDMEETVHPSIFSYI